MSERNLSFLVLTFQRLVVNKISILVMGKHLDDDEINMNLNNCKLSGRWIILQGKSEKNMLKTTQSQDNNCAVVN